MKGIQHPLMQNTLLNLANMFKEYDCPFAMEECDGRVATMEDWNGSGSMTAMERSANDVEVVGLHALGST